MSPFLDRLGFSESSHFLVEGRHAVQAAIDHAWPIERIFSSHPDKLVLAAAEIPITQLSKKELAESLNFDFHRGHLAIARRPAGCFPDTLKLDQPLTLLALCGLADPGNVGTIIRNAAAFGADAVLHTTQGADPFNPKSVRASATSIFQIPVLAFDLKDLDQLTHYDFVASSLQQPCLALPDWHPPANRGQVIFLGSEGPGLPAAIEARCQTRIKIPHSSKVESLNVATASALILSHRYQQHPSNS